MARKKTDIRRITAITCPTTAITTARRIRSHFCSKFIQSPIRSETTFNVDTLPEVTIAAQANTVASHLHSAFSFKPRIQYSATGHASAKTKYYKQMIQTCQIPIATPVRLMNGARPRFCENHASAPPSAPWQSRGCALVEPSLHFGRHSRHGELASEHRIRPSTQPPDLPPRKHRPTHPVVVSVPCREPAQQPP